MNIKLLLEKLITVENELTDKKGESDLFILLQFKNDKFILKIFSNWINSKSSTDFKFISNICKDKLDKDEFYKIELFIYNSSNSVLLNPYLNKIYANPNCKLIKNISDDNENNGIMYVIKPKILTIQEQLFELENSISVINKKLVDINQLIQQLLNVSTSNHTNVYSTKIVAG